MDKNNDIQQEAIDERIDSFIRGTMPEEEETAFKQEIQADPELRAQVLATISLIKGIRTQEAEKEKNIIDKNVRDKVVQATNFNPYISAPQASQVHYSGARSIMLWACSIAALFVIFFGVYKEKRYRDLSAIVSPYYSEYSMSDYSRGDLDSVSVAHLYTLFNNIKEQRNVSEIIKELEPIYVLLDSDFTYSAYANDISLNLALAYIKDDQIDKAITILEKLKEDNPETPIAAKATELLKKLLD